MRARHDSLPRRGWPDGLAVDDGFDAVAVGVEHVGAVVAGVVAPLARRSVIAVAGGERGSMKLVDGCPVASGEAEMNVPLLEAFSGYW